LHTAVEMFSRLSIAKLNELGEALWPADRVRQKTWQNLTPRWTFIFPAGRVWTSRTCWHAQGLSFA